MQDAGAKHIFGKAFPARAIYPSVKAGSGQGVHWLRREAFCILSPIAPLLWCWQRVCRMGLGDGSTRPRKGIDVSRAVGNGVTVMPGPDSCKPVGKTDPGSGRQKRSPYTRPQRGYRGMDGISKRPKSTPWGKQHPRAKWASGQKRPALLLLGYCLRFYFDLSYSAYDMVIW